MLVRYFLQGTPVPGFPFLASIVALFSGAQLFALGIIGEYLARMHFRSMQKPPYVVRMDAGRGRAAVHDLSAFPSTVPASPGNEYKYIAEAIANGHASGDGPFTRRCHEFLETGTRRSPRRC